MGNKVKGFLRRIHIRRTTILMLLFLLMSFILVRELYQLQIIQGKDFISNFQSRTTRTRVLHSARGKIYDGKGKLIAENILSYSVTLEDNGSYESLREKNLSLNGIAYRVIKILEKNGDSVTQDFHIKLDDAGNFIFDVNPGFTLSRFKADIYGYPLIDDLKEEEASATAEEMMSFLCGEEKFSIILTGEDAYTAEELTSHHLPLELTRDEQLKIAIIRYLLSTNSFKKYMPVTIATNVSEVSVAALMENQAELTGIDVIEDTLREYVDEVSMGPILGYIGRASAEELEELRKQNSEYTNDAIIGKAGIEQYMETTLQGTDGRETVTVDNLGKVLKIDKETQVDPVAGDDIQLTINTEWQATIYEILKQRVAGILLSKIVGGKTFDYDMIIDSAQIEVPIYDVYNALVENCVVDIRKFSREDASKVEKSLQKAFEKKQASVFEELRERLTGANPKSYKEEPKQMQEYLAYLCDDLLTDTLGILSSDAVDYQDPVFQAWTYDETISLKEYLTYAASQHWLNVADITPEGSYLDSGEVYQAMTDYVVDYLKTDYGFSKLLYKYMLQEDLISGEDLCLCLYEQGVLDKEDDYYESLSGGAMGAYDFCVYNIANLHIEPAQLALMPFAASAVVVDVHTGKVLALVSYPGYDNNRLTNDMDTDYFAKLALDQSSPFFNKATQQRTAPGSTMKLLSTIAGMMEGVINDGTYFDCTGSFDLVEPPIACWNTYGHGPIDIREAIQESCNYYFNMVGFLLGKLGDTGFSESKSLRMLLKYASLIGLDKKSGVEMTEAPPQVSDSLAVPSYMGQGTHAYTTVQLARYATVMATRGTVYRLSILDRVISPGGDTIRTFDPVIENQADVPDNVWEDIYDGMQRVVQTHRQFDNVSSLEIAGKTGTAQTDIYHPDHGVFVGFAPAYDPQYAIAVRIPNGYSSGNAALVAADIFAYIFNENNRDSIVTGYASDETSNVSND